MLHKEDRSTQARGVDRRAGTNALGRAVPLLGDSGVHCLSECRYRSFAELADARVEGVDYEITARRNAASSTAVVVPHGGRIEEGTSEFARRIAGEDLNLYLFEGLQPTGSLRSLHLTSHLFDEPRCLGLLSQCDHVVALHGCRGDRPAAFLGGLDAMLKQAVARAFAAAGIEVHLEGHRYPGVHPRNICNRGRRGLGVQIEMTSALRLGHRTEELAVALRGALLALSDPIRG